MANENDKMNRRTFITRIAGLSGAAAVGIGGGIWLSSRSQRPQEKIIEGPVVLKAIAPDPNLPELVVTEGNDPAKRVQSAVLALGGISRFISADDVVVIKPNIAWDRKPEQAANTDPFVIAEVVRLCKNAGAKEVIVTDNSCNDARRCFQRSGIAEAAGSAGAEIVIPDERRFKEVDFRGSVLKTWPVFEPFLKATKIINMPVAKHHSLTSVTLGLKNWYGIIGGRRNQLHQHIHESIADLTAFMQPTALTILDATRVLLRNGPTGGNLGDVAIKNTLIAGTDPVAVDAYTANAFWDIDYSRLKFLQLAHERGLGNMYFDQVRSKKIIV